MADTAIVSFLMFGGATRGQAEAWERCLEDRPTCGVGAVLLTRCIRRMAVREFSIVASVLKEQEIEIERLFQKAEAAYEQLDIPFSP